MIGTDGAHQTEYGGTMPLVTAPFGMTNWVAMTRENRISRNPYHYQDKTISGFIGTHQPAIWMGDYGQMAVMPGSGDIKTGFNKRAMAFNHSDEIASPCCYRVTMSSIFSDRKWKNADEVVDNTQDVTERKFAPVRSRFWRLHITKPQSSTSQPVASQMRNPGRHVFADVGEALEVSLDNLVKEETPAETPADPSAAATPKPATTPAPTPKPGTEEYLQKENFPDRSFKGNSQNARGLALTVTGDGSGALLVLQVGNAKDYVVPIDFTGRKDIFIPTSETSRTVGGWGMRYATKRATYGIFHGVFIGFGRVPANTHAKVLIENLRMVGEKPSSIKNPVIHAGAGTLAIQGEVKSDHYLWYQGGNKVGLYDKNWNLQAELPAVATNYEVDKGFSEYWIEGECATPPPWLDVQFITKGETVKLENAPPTKTNP